MEIELYNGTKNINRELLEKYMNSRDFLNTYTHEQMKDWKKVDLYFILGIDSLKYEKLDQKMLQKQLKRRLLKYHPDINKKATSDTVGLLNKAYEVLSDPLKKRRYDSLIFNDEIPEDREYDKDEFFEVFYPIFKRNEYFSVINPIPQIGDLNSDLKDVNQFYKFWSKFESWRTFEYFFINRDYDYLNSYNRKMEIAKVKSKIKQKAGEEMMRIARLVNIAHKRDPRLSQFKKKVEVVKDYAINPKLVSTGWTVAEIKEFGDLLGGPTRKNFNDVKWEEIFDKFNEGKENKKEYTAFMVKGKEIARMGLVPTQKVMTSRPAGRRR